MRPAIVIGTALLLAGCGSFSQLREQGADVADQGLGGVVDDLLCSKHRQYSQAVRHVSGSRSGL